MKRPTVRSRSRQVAAVAVLTGLLLVGFADAVRSQPAPVTDTASQPNAPAATKPPAASRQPKNRRRIYIVLAEHVILVRDTVTQNADLSEFQIVTWDQLLQLLRDASKTARIVPWIYETTAGFKQFQSRSLELTKVAKELKAPTWLLSFVQYDGSQVYDAIRGPDDLKPDPSHLREGTVRRQRLARFLLGEQPRLQPDDRDALPVGHRRRQHVDPGGGDAEHQRGLHADVCGGRQYDRRQGDR